MNKEKNKKFERHKKERKKKRMGTSSRRPLNTHQQQQGSPSITVGTGAAQLSLWKYAED
jgi:hypothetical protein